MAVKKSSGETKSQDVSAAKKAGGKKSAAKKETAPKQSSPSAAKAAAPKKTAGKKAAAAPIKLTATQTDLLKKIHETKDTGYLGGKGEAKALESLQTKKLIKRGAKDKEKGAYRYSVSKTGEKHINTPAAPKPTNP